LVRTRLKLILTRGFSRKEDLLTKLEKLLSEARSSS